MRQLISKLTQPTIFIVIGVLARVIPHPANFAPIAAIALFGGVYMNKKQALIVPILAMMLSDLVIGFDSTPMRLTIYGTFLVIVLVGFWLKQHKNTKTVILASLFSSVMFFVTTNFSVWAFGTMYPKTIFGLTDSYVFALPFFRNTLLGDLFYSGLFFGGYELVRSLIQKSKLVLAR
jgi:hypothetical protein